MYVYIYILLNFINLTISSFLFYIRLFMENNVIDILIIGVVIDVI